MFPCEKKPASKDFRIKMFSQREISTGLNVLKGQIIPFIEFFQRGHFSAGEKCYENLVYIYNRASIYIPNNCLIVE
jgi:hypothetical protein